MERTMNYSRSLRFSGHAPFKYKIPIIEILATMAILILASFSSKSLGQEDIILSYGDNDFVSIASGRKQLISRAPSVASVVTAEQIKKMGAKDITEVMESIPGVHVSRKAGGYNPIFIFRGIYTEFNPQVLILIDGIPLTSLSYGGRGQAWGGLPVEAISRIEVIRGPGSAIYGADAFAGTINIITKSPENMQQQEAGYSHGSYNTNDLWLNLAGNISGWKTSLLMEGVKSDGQDEIIKRDQQTSFDQIFGTNVSEAPGELSLSKNLYDLYFKAHKNNWKVNVNYSDHNDLGIGAGAASALDQTGRAASNRLTAQVTHTSTSLLPDTEIKSSLSYQRMRNQYNFVLFPPGASIAGYNFPEGVIGQPDTSEEHIRLHFSFFYSGIEGHDISVGTGFNYHDQYRVKEKKNYNVVLTPYGAIFVPLGGLVDVSNTTPFNQEKTRKVAYIYLQDVWSIAPDWSLTAGLRYDNYSDFGDTVNPRLALVWETSYAVTTKLLYGRAFRAPSFAELFNINNPVAVGSPNLAPETIDTYELALNYTPSTQLTLGANVFYYKMRDIIRFNPHVAENTGDQIGRGMEFEFEWDPFDALHINGNYALQSSEDKQTHHAVANAPERQAYIRGDLQFLPGWYADLQVNKVMGRKRAASDTRKPVKDYTKVDLVMRATRLIPTWEFSAGIKNLTNAAIYEPSLAPGAIPDDLPMPRRNYFAEIRKSF